MTSKQSESEWYANRNFVMAGEYAGEGEPDVMVEVQVAEDPAELARHIVRCVESHEPLLAACEAQEAFDDHCADCEQCHDGLCCEAGIDLSVEAVKLRVEAIAKAKEVTTDDQ